jgi:transposase
VGNDEEIMSRRPKAVYPGGLSHAPWQVLALVLRRATGQPGRVPRREVSNAIFYVLRTGC